MKTFSLKKNDIKKKWVLIDAKDAVLGRQQLSNCKIYRDENHKHEAQNPQIIDIASMNTKNKI